MRNITIILLNYGFHNRGGFKMIKYLKEKQIDPKPEQALSIISRFDLNLVLDFLKSSEFDEALTEWGLKGDFNPNFMRFIFNVFCDVCGVTVDRISEDNVSLFRGRRF